MSKKNILITGGAGYIGSHVLKQLGELDQYNLIVVDNLSNGHKENLLFGEFIEGDIGDSQVLDQIFKRKIDGILHFAGSIVVPESVEKPDLYYRNNTVNSLKLLEYAKKFEVEAFIFSSTAAVYGEKTTDRPVSEEDPTDPKNPYAASKLMTEQMIQDIAKVSSLRYVILRYFNVAGACPSGKIGQRGKNATHLMKVCAEAACGKRESVTIFGTDYPTKDGTGVRDYIHVVDLASAHVLALGHLLNGAESNLFNCGYSQGYSVKEVIQQMKKISSNDFLVNEGLRRAGDISKLTADSRLIREKLGWKAGFNKLSVIIKDAYNWEKRLNIDN